MGLTDSYAQGAEIDVFDGIDVFRIYTLGTVERRLLCARCQLSTDHCNEKSQSIPVPAGQRGSGRTGCGPPPSDELLRRAPGERSAFRGVAPLLQERCALGENLRRGQECAVSALPPGGCRRGGRWRRCRGCKQLRTSHTHESAGPAQRNVSRMDPVRLRRKAE